MEKKRKVKLERNEEKEKQTTIGKKKHRNI